jgi:plasmid stabilization system protein ParE
MLRYRVGSHIVIFGREGAAVDIVRVLHERIDIDSQLDT